MTRASFYKRIKHIKELAKANNVRLDDLEQLIDKDHLSSLWYAGFIGSIRTLIGGRVILIHAVGDTVLTGRIPTLSGSVPVMVRSSFDTSAPHQRYQKNRMPCIHAARRQAG